MSRTPQNLRVISADRVLEVIWTPELVDRLPYRYLRLECPCAACINEFTGERILQPETVPQDVRPTAVEFAGNYGLKVFWSDDHNSGIYTWDHLARLSAALRSAGVQ
jgi:DUF971 family protein